MMKLLANLFERHAQAAQCEPAGNMPTQDVDALLAEVYQFSNAGDFDTEQCAVRKVREALHGFRDALRTKRELADVHRNLGFLLFRESEEYDEREAHILNALELVPGNVNFSCNRLMVPSAAGRAGRGPRVCARYGRLRADGGRPLERRARQGSVGIDGMALSQRRRSNAVVSIGEAVPESQRPQLGTCRCRHCGCVSAPVTAGR